MLDRMSSWGGTDAPPTALDEAGLQALLALALERMRVPEGCAAVLEGSIAEGFGNPSSDVDFLLLDDSDETYAGTPTVLFAGGRRIEVRLRSTREAASDRAELWRVAARGERADGRIPEDLLNRCQRLSRALPLRGRELVARVQATLPDAELGPIASRAFGWRARQHGRLAVAQLALGERAAAASWAEAALTFGAKAWVALRGETYTDAKWLPEQLRRAREQAGDGSDRALTERCEALLPRARAGAADDERYVHEALALLSALGVAGCEPDPERVSFRRRPGVTTWPVDGRLHVLRDGREAFVLSDAAARAWRGVVFEQPLPRLAALAASPPAGSAAATPGAGRFMAAFHRLGFVRLAWRGGGTIAAAPPVAPPPGTARPPLTLGGATPEEGGAGVTLVPLPARRFATAGMALVWSSVMAENAREDAVGAFAQRQWGVLSVVARRMLRWTCLSLLSAYGVGPRPAHEEACALLAELPSADRRLAADALALDRRICVDDERSAREALAAVEAVVARMRAELGASSFPSSFADAAGWRGTLETFYDWVRIGAHLDSEFPLDDLRDVLLSVDQRRASPESTGVRLRPRW